MSRILCWPQYGKRKRQNDREETPVSKKSRENLHFSSQMSLFDSEDKLNFERRTIRTFAISNFYFYFDTPSPDAKILDCQKKAFTS